jgi:biotin carboxyl carrier protein
MQYAVEVNGRVRQVAVRRQAGTLLVEVDGRSWDVDAAPVGGHGLSLLVSGLGRIFSHDVTLAGDAATGHTNVYVDAFVIPVTLNGRRRSGRKEDGAQSGTGPQRLLAPMPGKVVRLLVKQGDRVRARQSIAVIEAMKMENELRAGRDGVVVELPVTGGQSVEAGTLIAVVAANPSD